MSLAMLRYLGLALLLICVTAWADMPEPIDNYLNDYAGVLTVSERQRVQTIAAELEQESGVELTIVLIDAVASYQEGVGIEAFATRLFNEWGVGNAEHNDGILLLFAYQDRAVHIELGAGYGRDYDAQMQGIIDDKMLPAFKSGRYGPGLIAGAESLVEFAHDWRALRESDSLLAQIWLKIKTAFRSLWAQLGLLFAAGGVGWQLFRRWNRNRARQCEQCQSDMVRLSEALDDRYLESGQRLEERVGSIDYDVWKCTQCEHHVVIDYPALLSRYRRCSSCKRRTCEKQSRVVLDDRVITTYRCRHCQHIQKTYTAVQDSSARSSFGGGRSGGGGATGRW